MDDMNITIKDIVLPTDIGTLIETVKGKLQHKKSDISPGSSHVRIPDLTVTDKKKILDLIDVLAKVNAEKENVSNKLNISKQEIETYKTQLAQKDEDQTKLIADLKTMIDQLETKIKEMEDKKDMEVTVLRTQHEIDMKKVVYNNSLQTQKLQSRMMEDLQYQKKIYEAQIDQLKHQVADVDNSSQAQLSKLSERNKLSNNLITILEKDKSSLETKLYVCRGKLKTAVAAIQKLKSKLEEKYEKASKNQARSSQTVLTMFQQSTSIKKPVEKHELKEKESVKLTNVEHADEAIISEIFFHKDSLTDIIDPVFYPVPSTTDRHKGDWLSNK